MQAESFTAKNVGSDVYNNWQICDGSKLKIAKKEDTFKEINGNVVLTPDLSNKFIKGVTSKSNQGVSKDSKGNEFTGKIKLNANQIPKLNISGLDILASKINDSTKNMITKLNAEMASDKSIGSMFTNAYNHLNNNCKHINNLSVEEGGTHNHTINFFNNNFNEYGSTGEPCKGTALNASCGGTGGGFVDWAVDSDYLLVLDLQ